MWISGFSLAFLSLLPETLDSTILLKRARRLHALTGNPKLRSQSQIDEAARSHKEVIFENLVRPSVLAMEPAAFFCNLYLGLVCESFILPSSCPFADKSCCLLVQIPYSFYGFSFAHHCRHGSVPSTLTTLNSSRLAISYRVIATSRLFSSNSRCHVIDADSILSHLTGACRFESMSRSVAFQLHTETFVPRVLSPFASSPSPQLVTSPYSFLVTPRVS
jgi:hypothetical protein